jgi:hypothetical protein
MGFSFLKEKGFLRIIDKINEEVIVGNAFVISEGRKS